MPQLFGVDIAGQIAAAFAGQLVPAVLVKRAAGTRTPGQLTGGTNPTSSSISCEGFIEDKDEVHRAGTLVRRGGKFVSLLGASIDGGAAEPEVGDRVTIEGATYEIVEVASRDPAAALFVLRVEL